MLESTYTEVEESASSCPDTATHRHEAGAGGEGGAGAGLGAGSSCSHCSTRTSRTPAPPMCGMETTTGFLRCAVRCGGPTTTTGVSSTSPCSRRGLGWGPAPPATTATHTSSARPGSMAPWGTVRLTALRGMVTLAPASPTRVQVTCCWSAHRGTPRLAGSGPGLGAGAASLEGGVVLEASTRIGCS